MFNYILSIITHNAEAAVLLRQCTAGGGVRTSVWAGYYIL